VKPTDGQAALRAVVECLLTAHYSEVEIVDYLTGPMGVAEADALRALHEVSGTGDIVLAVATQSASITRRAAGLPSGSSTVR
jgi:hypothetical protein